MAGNADESIKPVQKLSTAVRGSDTWGRSIEKGAVPRIEIHITNFRPYRSPIGPPTSVPAAVETTKMNRNICDIFTDRPNF